VPTTGGWGNADVGGAWSIVGNTANWSVASGSGTVSVAPVGEERATLSATSVQDVEILQQVTLPRSNGNNDLAYILGRYTGGATPTYYRVGVGQGSGLSTMIIRGQRSDGTNLAADVNTGIPAADGASVWLRVQFQGAHPTAIRARAWLTGTVEPTTWMLDTTDVNPAEQGAGVIGVRDRNEDAFATRVFHHTQFQAVALPAAASFCPAGAVACDTFNRTISGGWGSADVGGAWNSSGANYTVTPGSGSLVVNPTAPQSFLPSVSLRDVDARVWIAPPPFSDTGDAGIAVRYAAGGGTYYQVSVYYPSGINGSNYVVQLKRKPENVLINPDAKTTIRGGTAVWIRMQAQGVSPTTLRWKVWQDGTPEPAAWMGTGTDSNPPEQAAGAVGIEGYVHSGTATVSFNGLAAAPIGTWTGLVLVAARYSIPLIGLATIALVVLRRRRRGARHLKASGSRRRLPVPA
jgi:hypothetical protein